MVAAVMILLGLYGAWLIAQKVEAGKWFLRLMRWAFRAVHRQYVGMDYDGDRTPALDGIRTDYHGEQCFTERQRRLDLILADHVYCHLCGAGDRYGVSIYQSH